MSIVAPRSIEGVISPVKPLVRPVVRGKFLFTQDAKLYVRGATYGTFALDESGNELHTPAVVERDFAMMAANGLNAIRTYTVPPRWLLDAAHRYRLRVMIGLGWEQHVAFLDDPERCIRIERDVRASVRLCSGHPAILCYAVGNEIPAGVVRWHGRKRTERFIERLFQAVKTEDPTALVTYVNYPTTEYLQLPFLDLVCFNVYLETQQRLSAYLPRLQNLAGDRPLVIAEVGLDSRRHGEEVQGQMLDRQLESIFESGCAGAFVYAWTDEWHRGGYPIDDWDFGLTRRDRKPKPALAAVRRAYAQVPFRSEVRWPRISVVVCAFNAQSTIRESLEALRRVEYPDFEVIVVNDGSTDATAAIAGEYRVRLISTPNQGLSNARNVGLRAASGEIVAYLDSDAFPDKHWLKYLAAAFSDSRYAGIGGPNLAPPGLGLEADCYDNAPGGPVHVLLTDREAEHIPGCNMAFRREKLEAVNGFDPALRVAGDDVDICWRFQSRGWSLGFSPSAVVWHHRRTTLRSYWKQQRGYGRAEALLERKWPQKYNTLGHLTWGGRIYAKGVPEALGLRRYRVYQGPWGSAPFQSLERITPTSLWSLTLMPEWYLVIAALAAFSPLGLLWRPLLLVTLPLLAIALAPPLLQALQAARDATFETKPSSRLRAFRARALVAILHVAGPLARLAGRMEYGLTSWRAAIGLRISLLRPRVYAIWSEHWRSPAAWLEALEKGLIDDRAVTARGGDYDSWDLTVRGALGFARLRALLEEHGAGKQLARFRAWPGCSIVAVVLACGFSGLALASGFAHAWAACGILGAIGLGVAGRAALESAAAMERVDRTVERIREVFNCQR